MAYFSKPQSAAVKIVKPTNDDEPVKQPQPRKDSVQRQCRNVVIYGSCKYQHKGCAYYHPPPPDARPATPQGPRADSPITGTLIAQAVNAPVFVPKATVTVPAVPTPPPTTVSHEIAATSSAPQSPAAHTEEYRQDYPSHESYDNYDYQQGEAAMVEGVSEQMDRMDMQYYDEQAYQHYQPEYDQNALDAAYYTAPPVFIRQPLNYHLYTPTTYPDFASAETNTHFVPPSSELRQLLQVRSETIHSIAPAGLKLPEELQGYHTLVPLEPSGTGVERRKFGNWYSTVYRAIRSSDGLPYALRRIENFRLTRQSAFAPIEVWSSLRHPGIISVREAFTTRSFDDNSLVVVYAYHPNSQTLFDAHLKPKPPTYQSRYQHGRQQLLLQAQSTVIAERTIWSYIVQIACAVKKVHDLGQAVRMIDVSKVLVTGQNRIRISSCGIVDVLMHDTVPDMVILQQEDLTMFGRLVFALCCNNILAATSAHFQKSLELIGRLYSADVKNVALFLISKGGPHRNIDQLLDMIRGKVIQEQEEALNATDRLEHELQSELENARLVRLLCKFGFINERPEFAREPRWAETGDRYIIKLFRDYVFHQMDEQGNPVLNMSHVLTCLNKLDAGTDEKIMLVARDEQNCLVVSYKEIKACIEGAFTDLARATTAAQAAASKR